MGSFLPIRSEADMKPDRNQIISGISILTVFTLMPIFFWAVLYANRRNLDKEDVKVKIGAMY